MTSVVKVDGETLVCRFGEFSLDNQDHNKNETQNGGEIQEMEGEGGCHRGTCAICLDMILLEETALIKGCEHAYCVTCILRWASYRKEPTCPQCKHPFEFLNVHRSLDGSLHDYMFEESVCLLLRASWFKPLPVEDDKHEDEDLFEYLDGYYLYEEEDDVYDDAEFCYHGSSSVRIGNRRWGDNGYVRSGRLEARSIFQPNWQDEGAGSSCESRKRCQ